MNTKGYLDMELLRFTTAGSVDDGKSTLIGRLLYDSKSIFEDQMEAIEKASLRVGNEDVNLALLTDGLRSEREQGITIDVAYRYFATPKRKFIIADTPGHIQYTRNMVTGASTADLAIILVDARNGVLEQTIRHSYIASLLNIEHVVVCINKMDLVDFSQEVFDNICSQYSEVVEKLKIKNPYFIPISAKLGDNVVDKSEKMDWYSGIPLLEYLEDVSVDHKQFLGNPRLPVQYVIRPMSDKFHDYRGYTGTITGGQFSKGDKVMILPSGISTQIKTIHKGEEEVETATMMESVSMQLTNDIDISRGDMIVGIQEPLPKVKKDLRLTVCWFNQKPLLKGTKYIVKQTSRETIAIIKNINFSLNINTLEQNNEVESVGMNDIASIDIRTSSDLVFESYKENKTTGSLILIDPNTFETVGAGVID